MRKKAIELPIEIREAIEKIDELGTSLRSWVVRGLKNGCVEIIDKDPERPIVLLDRSMDECYLAGLDTDGTELFVTRVNGRLKTVREAFDSITPFLVGLTRGFLKWQRQGDVWFLKIPFKRRKQEPAPQPIEHSSHKADFVRDVCGSLVRRVIAKIWELIENHSFLGFILVMTLFFGLCRFYVELVSAIFVLISPSDTIGFLPIIVFSYWIGILILNFFLLRGIPEGKVLKLLVTGFAPLLPLLQAAHWSYHLSQSVMASGIVSAPHHKDLNLGENWHLVQFNRQGD